MCFACDMEAMWFAVMEARAATGEHATERDEADEPATPPVPGRQEEAPTLLPPPERGRVGEGVAGGTDEIVGMRDASEDPHPNPPLEEGGGGAPSEGTRERQRSASSRRFACEETSAE
jgi:hypothetical protein